MTLDKNEYMIFHYSLFGILHSYFADFYQNFNLDRISARNIYSEPFLSLESNSTSELFIVDTLIYYRVDLYFQSVENVVVENAEALFLRPTEEISIYLETLNKNISLFSIKPDNIDLNDFREARWEIAMSLVPKEWYIALSRFSVCTMLEITDFYVTIDENPARLVIHGLHSLLTPSDVLNISNDTIHVCRDDYDVLIQPYMSEIFDDIIINDTNLLLDNSNLNETTKVPTQTSSATLSGTDLLNMVTTLITFFMLNCILSDPSL